MAVGARTSLVIGLLATLLSGAAGTLLGLLAGYFGGKTDLLISRLIDVALAFPSLLLAIGISVVLPPGGLSVVVAISMTGWASFARLLRSRTIVLKRADYAVAGKVLGSSSFRILFRHVFPNCAAVLVVSASLKLGSFMLAESGLSFLGLGVPPPYPSLGWMIASGRDYLITAPWVPLLPGILIAALVLAANLAGESLEKHLDPKRRGGR
jgi:ABC-type dipeptide/oligopeptide/nickel transport system permease subunit